MTHFTPYVLYYTNYLHIKRTCFYFLIMLIIVCVLMFLNINLILILFRECIDGWLSNMSSKCPDLSCYWNKNDDLVPVSSSSSSSSFSSSSSSSSSPFDDQSKKPLILSPSLSATSFPTTQTVSWAIDDETDEVGEDNSWSFFDGAW
jgi:hypothetical protein